MSLDQDFELPAEDNPPADASVGEGEGVGSTEPQPLVVIQYRNRGIPPFLIPPLLVLLAAGVIMSYQRQTPPRSLAVTAAKASKGANNLATASATKSSEDAQGELNKEVIHAPVAAEGSASIPAAVAPPGSTPASPVESSETLTVRKPVALVGPAIAARAGPDEKPGPPEFDPKPETKATTPPHPLAAATESPTATPESSPFDLDPQDGLRKVEAGPARAADSEPAAPKAATPEPAPRPAIGFNPLPDAGLPPPEPLMQPKPEVVVEQIEREVQREAQQKEAERQELEAVKLDARFREIQEAVDRAEEQRVPFRNDLREILKSEPSDRASLLIEDLCERYGRDTVPQISQTVRRMRQRMSGRFGHQEMVELMRNYGLPETLVLDYLAQDIRKKSMNARGGPRNEREVLVRAAWLLLKYSVTQARSDSPPRASAGRSFAGVAPTPPRRPGRVPQ
jgi:hypothetical protein